MYTTKEIKPSKVYICLFTCAAVWALHLELVEDKTTQALGHSEDSLVDVVFSNVSFLTMLKPSKLKLKNSK